VYWIGESNIKTIFYKKRKRGKDFGTVLVLVTPKQIQNIEHMKKQKTDSGHTQATRQGGSSGLCPSS
jgi:hypothetical protein